MQWCFRVVNESGQVLFLLSMIAIGREIGKEVQVRTRVFIGSSQHCNTICNKMIRWPSSMFAFGRFGSFSLFSSHVSFDFLLGSCLVSPLSERTKHDDNLLAKARLTPPQSEVSYFGMEL